MRFLVVASLVALATHVASEAGGEYIRFLPLHNVAKDSLQNIHIEYEKKDFTGELRVAYGDCDLDVMTGVHHLIGTTDIEPESKPKKFVWIVPEDAQNLHCLHAFSGSRHVGRSAPLVVEARLRKRQSIADVADINGPWFEGIAYMKSKNNTHKFVAEAKSKKIAIVGGGMAGLMTSLLLQSVGIQNWEIMESSNRVGGRIRTKYFGRSKPSDYQYQEMGPMRFPVSITYPGFNETLQIKDHQMVFQLAETLNRMNKQDPELAVKFIPFIPSHPNNPGNSRGVRLPDGTIPSNAQIAADPTLAGIADMPFNMTEAQAAAEGFNKFLDFGPEKLTEIATNIFKAHKKAVEDGVLDWSESNYLHYALGISLNTTNFLAGAGGSAIWETLYEGTYFTATSWRTIDKGLESLPRAFGPHIKNKVKYGRKITGLTWKNETGKIAVNWRDQKDRFSLKTQTAEFDYAVVAAPFTKVRLWRNPPYSSLLSRAINTMTYSNGCKVALKYKTRFWEKSTRPIFGGCGYPDIPSIGSICYPSFGINSTGPGVLLASYNYFAPADATTGMTEEEHVAWAQRGVVEAHGSIAEKEFTGEYDRKCWATDENSGGGWATPTAGQQQLFLPAYYQTEFKTIFIGEHTSYTHAWIFSALDSAVRGTAQLLLDLGLIDEAKEIVNTWMGRWIDI